MDAVIRFVAGVEGDFDCYSEICCQGDSDKFLKEQRLRHLKNEKMQCHTKKYLNTLHFNLR